MLKRVLFCVIAASLLWIAPAWPQSVNRPYEALRTLEERIHAGLTYRDYMKALDEVKKEVDAYAAGENADPSLKDGLTKALGHYDQAASVWTLRFSRPRDFGSGLIPPAFEKNVLQKMAAYPKLTNDIAEGGARLDGQLRINDILRVIWLEASKELKRTQEFLTEGTPAPSVR